MEKLSDVSNRSFTCLSRNSVVWASLLDQPAEDSRLISFHQMGASFLGLSSEGPWTSEPARNDDDEQTEPQEPSSVHHNFFGIEDSLRPPDNLERVHNFSSRFSIKTVLANEKGTPPHRSKETSRRKITKRERELASKAKLVKNFDDLDIKVRNSSIQLTIRSQHLSAQGTLQSRNRATSP